jgi:hypothetical protein
MNLRQTSTKRVALVLLAAAIVVPAALGNSGQPVPGNSHLADLTAMGNAYQAQASRIASVPTSNTHLADLTAMGNAYQATGTPTPAAATSSNFNWGDAGIGATSGFAAAIALVATLLFVLRRRPRGQGLRTPTTA